jgi:uncharacterized membrane protein
MASYKDRLTRDLDNWIAGGLVPLSSRTTILASVEARRTPDAPTALAYIGAALLGLAVIAFVAANWSGIPRVGRYVLITALFAAGALGAAWSAARRWNNAANALLAFAALAFAADIGLTGQIFDLSGDPQTALYGAAAAALLLALAGRSSAAAVVALALAGLGDISASSWTTPCVIAAGGIAAVALAVWWRSRVLAHGAGAALVLGVAEALRRIDCAGGPPSWMLLLAASAALAALALGARFLARGPRASEIAGVLYLWFAAGALLFFAACGTDAKNGWAFAHRVGLIGASAGLVLLGRRDDSAGLQIIGWIAFWMSMIFIGFEVDADGPFKLAFQLAHRVACLGGASAMIVQGRIDNRAWLTGLGVAAMLATACLILSDFGLSLMAAAGVFAISALIALVVGLVLRRRGRA